MSTKLSGWANLTERDAKRSLETMAVAAEYIESIGKTDLYEFSKEEFETLLLVVCNDFCKDYIPF